MKNSLIWATFLVWLSRQVVAEDSSSSSSSSNGGIEYWTEYAILPKRCIVYNNVDVIVFSVYEHSYKQCSDEPLGTYVAPVHTFVNGYLQQKAQDMEDQGVDDYVAPDVAQYTDCTPFEIQNQYYYFQLGCADDSTQALAVNIYSDNTCTTPSVVDGYDDSNIDVSAIGLKFKKCQACVQWADMNEEQDDQFYVRKQTEAPFCSNAWQYKEECDKKCQKIGLEKQTKEGWNSSDKILLAILSLFALIMVGLIFRKRQKMTNKDTLLEQAAMNAAGLQQPHVIGILILVVLVIAVFALLGLKNITWGLLLVLNTVLFAYLMKLTLDSSVRPTETIIGPDGTILRRDSDDSSMESSSRDSSRRGIGGGGGGNGPFVLPTLA